MSIFPHRLFRSSHRFLIIIILLIFFTGCSSPVSLLGKTPVSLSSSPTSDQTGISPMPALKILVSGDGMVRITDGDLQAAGLPVEKMDLQNVNLSLQGTPVPIWVRNQAGAWSISFYGRSTDSVYTANNVYWLQFGSQSADEMSTAEIPPAGNSTNLQSSHTYTISQHTEQQLIYSPQVKDGDHWFWASIAAPKSQDFEVSLPHLSSETTSQGYLKISLYATTQSEQNPDHHLQALINGRLAADERWDGQGWQTLDAIIPAAALKEGKNQVTISLPGDTGAPADILLLNWIEIVYDRDSRAENDRLEFNSSGLPQNIAGFSGAVEIFDISDANHVLHWPSILPVENGGFVFQGLAGHRYLAIGPQGFLDPTSTKAAATSSDLRTGVGGADYVAIGPPDLLAPLKPLLEWRQKQGLKVVEIPIDSVYDQFNHGMPEPEAIRSFLNYAHQNWQPAPRYVLLVGDATYDPRGYVSATDANRLPTFFVDTGFGGETASDVVFAQPETGAAPQIAVGRVPARQPEQVKNFVDKVLAYEQTDAPADWRTRLLAVADGQDPAFKDEAQSFLDQLPQGYKKELYSPEAGVKDAAHQVQSYFSEGYLLIAYFGHGSVNMWGKDQLFSTSQIKSLTKQEALPIVLSFTCLNGLFTHPKVDSMAEALLFQPEGGAVSVLAPSSLTLPVDQSFLEHALVVNLEKRPALTLGEAFLSAQQQIPLDSPGSRDVLETFLLFGDPALHIAWPTQ
jgi:hypothetical protein